MATSVRHPVGLIHSVRPKGCPPRLDPARHRPQEDKRVHWRYLQCHHALPPVQQEEEEEEEAALFLL